MDFESVIKKLNKVVHTLNADRKNSADRLRLKFIAGRVEDALLQIIKMHCPFGKVAFVASDDSYQKYSSQISNIVESGNAKYFGLSVRKEFFIEQERLTELFNLPEDIRLIITTDDIIAEKISYFANVNKIPTVIIPTSFAPQSHINPIVFIKNHKGVDAVNVNPLKYVVFDEEFFDFSIASDAYAHIVSKLISIKDYVARCAIRGKKPNKACYTIVKNAVYQTINSVKERSIKNDERLILNAFTIETVNAFLFGQMATGTAEEVAGLISSIDKEETFYEGELKSAIKILELYQTVVGEDKANLLAVPNYNERAEKLAGILSIPETAVLKSFLSQTESLINGRKTAETIIDRLKSQLKKETTAKKKILETYYKLGGKDQLRNEEINLAIKFAGDYIFGINLMTIVRENGITEYI